MIASRMHVLATAFAVGLFAWSSRAEACSCADWHDTVERMQLADAVFVGRVETIDVPWVMRPSVAEAFLRFPLSAVYVVDHEIRTGFAVERRYKGALGHRVWVNTGDFLGFDCEVPNIFSGAPQRWLVFASEREDGELYVGACMHPLGELDGYEGFATSLAELPQGSAEPHFAADWSSYRGPAPSRASIAFALGGGVVALLRRRRRGRRRADV